MSLFTRIARYMRALIHGNLDKWEDPGVLIEQAVRDMKENQIRNRELAVQAITQKNTLQAEVAKQERLAAEYEKRATFALQSGNRELAKQFLKGKTTVETTLVSLRQSLVVAIEASERVKVAIRAEEEHVRQRIAEAQGMQARLKQAQVQEKIQNALGQFSLNDNQNTWEEVERRIQEKQSRALALGELQNLSIDAKLHEIEMYQMDVSVEQELDALERTLADHYPADLTQQSQTRSRGSITQ